jgi:phenylacetate-CoA oxygenase PaaH subunit
VRSAARVRRGGRLRRPRAGDGQGATVIYEVFRQERKGQAFAHAGSLEAPNDEFAEEYAREFYGRRQESEALWVVPRTAVHEITDFVDELERNYHRVDGYSLKVKLKEARERAGTSTD